MASVAEAGGGGGDDICAERAGMGRGGGDDVSRALSFGTPPLPCQGGVHNNSTQRVKLSLSLSFSSIQLHNSPWNQLQPSPSPPPKTPTRTPSHSPQPPPLPPPAKSPQTPPTHSPAPSRSTRSSHPSQNTSTTQTSTRSPACAPSSTQHSPPTAPRSSHNHSAAHARRHNQVLPHHSPARLILCRGARGVGILSVGYFPSTPPYRQQCADGNRIASRNISAMTHASAGYV